jgi:NAD(P)-dependent dehydrogenase (short-subunit alcohol dehydrogenase family)
MKRWLGWGLMLGSAWWLWRRSQPLPPAQGQAVLISGASTGIGRAVALDLDRRGYRVFAGVRHAADAAALCEEASDRLSTVMLDVTDHAQIHAAVAHIQAAVGADGLAGLINNAGIGITGPIEMVDLKQWRQQFEVNFFGAIALTQACLPLLRQGQGRIINMSSASGRLAAPTMGPYSASKWALEALSDTLRLELERQGIHISVIQPGAVDTPIWGKERASGLALWEDATDDMRELYGPIAEDMMAYTAQAARMAVSVRQVTRAAHHALAAPVPHIRYLIGPDAYGMALLALLPDRLRDRLLRQGLFGE